MTDFFIDTYVMAMCCIAAWAVLDCTVRALVLIGDVLDERGERVH